MRTDPAVSLNQKTNVSINLTDEDACLIEKVAAYLKVLNGRPVTAVGIIRNALCSYAEQLGVIDTR